MQPSASMSLVISARLFPWPAILLKNWQISHATRQIRVLSFQIGRFLLNSTKKRSLISARSAKQSHCLRNRKHSSGDTRTGGVLLAQRRQSQASWKTGHLRFWFTAGPIAGDLHGWSTARASFLLMVRPLLTPGILLTERITLLSVSPIPLIRYFLE